MKSAKLLLIATVCLTAFNSYAITETFNFTIKSSGPTMYACNAGLRHVDRGSQVITNVPSGTLATNDDGASLSGDNYVDYMRVDTGSWDGDKATITTTNRTVVGNGSGGYATVFGNNPAVSDIGASYGRIIDKLSFNLSTERYGSEFFVDICYTKPQIDLDGVANVTAQASVAITDTTAASAKSYVSLSGIANKTEIYCTTGDSENGSPYSRSSGGFTPITSPNFATVLPQASICGVPNRCIVRFYFSENNVNSRRLHQLQSAAVQVKAEIVEPPIK